MKPNFSFINRHILCVSASLLFSSYANAGEVAIQFLSGKLPAYSLEQLTDKSIAVTFEKAVPYRISSLPYQVQELAPGKTRIVIPFHGVEQTVVADAVTAIISVKTSSAAAKAQAPAAGGTGSRDDIFDDLKNVTQKPATEKKAEIKSALEARLVLGDEKKASSLVDHIRGKVAEKIKDKSPDEVKRVVSDYTVDLSIPESPGLTIVGLVTEDVIRPSSPRALAAALQTGVDKEGKGKTGLAIEFAPMKLFVPSTPSEDYQRSALVRALWNTQVSIATAKPTDATEKTLKAGLGLSSVLYKRESSDPLRNSAYSRCYDTVIRKQLEAIEKQPALGITEFKDLKTEGETETAAQKCYSTFLKSSWNGTAIVLGLATSQYSESGKWSDGKRSAHGGWLSMGYGFEEFSADSPIRTNMHLIATYKRLFGERVTDPLDAKKTIEQNGSLLGAKLRWRGDDRNYFIEQSYQRNEYAGRPTDKIRRSAIGFEWKLGENLWLVSAVGGESGRKNGVDSSFVTSGLKYGSSTESLFSK
jgi:hypothetical protein